LIERTLGDPPGETMHWTSRAMANVMGVAINTVQRSAARMACRHTGCGPLGGASFL